MKKYFVFLLVLNVLWNCASEPVPHGMELNSAVREAASRIEAHLPAGTEVAVISVASPSAQFSKYVLTSFESVLVNNGKLSVVDRSNLDKVRAEQGFQMSGEVSDESAKSIGKMLGAGAIVTGSFTSIGNIHSLTLKAINIETARVTASYMADIANDERVKALLASGGSSGGSSRVTYAKGSASTASEVPDYNIGDVGPAGGLIFFNKGNNVGGWRYLEAAPENTESVLAFGDIFVNATFSRKVGDGKENSDKYIARINERGGGVNTAVWYCDELSINNFNDWYLPALDELLYMYNNLYLSGNGGLKNARYWSSTYKSSTGNQYVDFSNGEEHSGMRSKKLQVRAVRRF